MPSQILLVYCRSGGGAPIDFALPRIASRGEVHILALQPLPTRTESLWRPHCAELIPAYDRVDGDALVDLIMRTATKVGADAVLSLAETAAIEVAMAARRLGLRGAGPNVSRSRDKRLMRATWHDAGVPIPRFRPVSSEAALRRAFGELTPPLLLKAAWGFGSVGHLVIDREERIAPAWAQIHATMTDANSSGRVPLFTPRAVDDFLVEEIIPGTTRSWYPDGSGYGDHLSVEGIVVDGVYHPVCITARFPTIPPFTEMGNVMPSVLPEHLQRKIEATARAAVDALDLQTCGTHTEIKLTDGTGLSVIESGARLGGAMIAAQIEHVFGYDLIGMLTDGLLGLPCVPPERMLTGRDAQGAASSLPLIACDATGNPWIRDLIWDESRVDWTGLLTTGTRIEAVPHFTVPDGTPMPRHDPSGGVVERGGIFYVRANDPDTLVRDARAVLNGMESALASGA